MSDATPPATHHPMPGAGKEINTLLTKKVFGVPVLVFALAGAAVLLYFALKMKGSSATTPTDDSTDDSADTSGDDTTDESTGDADNADDQQPVFLVPNGQTTTETTDTGTTVGTTGMAIPASNDEWGQEAQTWLLGQGYTVQVAGRVVQNYLNGDTLSASDADILNKVVAEFGLPPDGAPVASVVNSGTTTTTGPATKQGTPPLKHVVTGNKDTDFSQLAVLYYGSNSADKIATIKADPSNVGMKTPFTKGMRVEIPANSAAKYYTATSSTLTLAKIAAKNGERTERITDYNPGMKFPVKVGTRVRVG